MAKRLTVIPNPVASAPVAPKPPRPAVVTPGKPKVAERREQQRRLSIGRRVTGTRRDGDPVTLPDPLFEDHRHPSERRGMAVRRRLSDRRSGVRLLDLTNLDLSELDS